MTAQIIAIPPANQYLLVYIEEQASKLNGTTMWRLTFMKTDDYQVYETTVDASYNNFERNGWAAVVHDARPYGIYQGLRRSQRQTRSGSGVITADSHPVKIAHVDTHAEIVEILQQLQRDQAQARSSQFNRLFS